MWTFILVCIFLRVVGTLFLKVADKGDGVEVILLASVGLAFRIWFYGYLYVVFA